MKTLLTTGLLLIYSMTFSQGSYQFADTTKKWNTLTYGSWAWDIVHCGGTKTNKISGEVVLNDMAFWNIFEAIDSLQQDWDNVGIIREATIEKKVYFSMGDPGEIGLIYDFDLIVGDCVVIDNYYVGFENVVLICDSIDFLTIYGSGKKRFFLHSPDHWDSDVWIEGIGSKFGLLYSGLNGALIAGGGTDLLCCSKNDTLIYMDSVYNSCYIQEFYPKISSEYYDTAYLNTYYEFQVQVSDTGNIGSYELIGNVIPNGFEFNEATGLLTGTPVATGLFPCIITIRNNDLGFLTDILNADLPVVLANAIDNLTDYSKISIHPNPFTTSFVISGQDMQHDSYILEVYNSEGLLIDKSIISELPFEIVSRHYPIGLYLVKITDVMNRKMLICKGLKH